MKRILIRLIVIVLLSAAAVWTIRFRAAVDAQESNCPVFIEGTVAIFSDEISAESTEPTARPTAWINQRSSVQILEDKPGIRYHLYKVKTSQGVTGWVTGVGGKGGDVVLRQFARSTVME